MKTNSKLMYCAVWGVTVCRDICSVSPLIILLLASLFYGFAFQQLLDGNNESFQTLSTIGSVISLINAVMNLNNIYNAAGEIKRINSRIAEKLVRLIIATNH